MIAYHGTPLTGTKESTARFLAGRHALVPFTYQHDLAEVIAYAASFVVDNGAFSAWTKGVEVSWSDYYAWVESLRRLPSFDWAVIPDVIGGSEDENDALLTDWPAVLPGVPVWHVGESVDRLVRLAAYGRVAIGAHPSSSPGSLAWWDSIIPALDAITDGDGVPACKLHGLRMLNPDVFGKIPLSSADSVNVARNSNNSSAIASTPSRLARMEMIAARIELSPTPSRWERHNQQTLCLF
jgi:hypothetical protein